ncbi:MBL fold metallo-hydrolase [Thiospirochaeta perfilievii]|uniref:MBL fold metallo-hydrolase n=1 Tax=Thiospirochaeta perfilievii TaxID=252967 RepID=A0A5C1QA51_9SPIO|nr:MBL fold metallo-hydrolase [Thiospirochaeta perfilievii]QEN03686.1 MBL fold metallo-hydrolase [Thiospirochaeta perfilievii]
MELTFLGTGTSHGIPVITCNCRVCRSLSFKNRRLRSSIYIKSGNSSILIDTSPEFRIQANRCKINSLDAVFYTHTHADHLHGIDDLRPLSMDKTIPLYGKWDDIDDIEKRFPYIFNSVKQLGGGKPNLETRVLNDSVIIGDLKVTPIPIKHGVLDIYGYRINNTAYLTDCSTIPKNSYKLLKGVDTLIIGALRYRSHSTHFNIDEAVEEIRLIKPEYAYLTHICHDVEHYKLTKELKKISKNIDFIKKIKPAHDGLCLKSV